MYDLLSFFTQMMTVCIIFVHDYYMSHTKRCQQVYRKIFPGNNPGNQLTGLIRISCINLHICILPFRMFCFPLRTQRGARAIWARNCGRQ